MLLKKYRKPEESIIVKENTMSDSFKEFCEKIKC